MPVGTEAEVDEVEHRGRARDGFEDFGVIVSSVFEVYGFHGHRINLRRWEWGVGKQALAQVGEIAVGIATGGDPLVDLNDMHLRPRNGFVGKSAEHLPRSFPSAHRHNKASASSNRGAGFGGDELSSSLSYRFRVGQYLNLHGISGEKEAVFMRKAWDFANHRAESRGARLRSAPKCSVRTRRRASLLAGRDR